MCYNVFAVAQILPTTSHGVRFVSVAKNEDDVIRQDVFDGVVGDFRQGWVHLVYQSENIVSTSGKTFKTIPGNLRLSRFTVFLSSFSSGKLWAET